MVIAVARDRRRSSAPGSSAARGSTRPRSSSPCSTSRCRCSSSSLGLAVRLLARGAHERLRLRHGPGLARPRLRAAARDARVHGARDRRQPRRGDARARARAAALAVLVDRARRDHDRADRDRRRCRRSRPRTARPTSPTTGSRRRSSGIVTAFEGHLPAAIVDILRVVVGLSGALILFAAATTAITGCTRLGRSMAEHGMLPREFGRLERRSLVSREALVATGAVAIAIVIVTGHLRRGRPGLPRQRVLVRRAVRLHGGAARRDPAAPQGAGSRAPVPGQAGGQDSRRARAAAGPDRRAADVRRLGARADHASRRALRRPGLAARRARASTSSSGGAARSASSTTSIPSRRSRRAWPSRRCSCR